MKYFEVMGTLATTLSSWALVMLGGSVLAILSTGYYRPKALWLRCTYLLFLPAWLFLSLSLYSGTRVQEVYLNALYRAPRTEGLEQFLEMDAVAQIRRLELGLAFFGLWLALYLGWWIFNQDVEVKQMEVKLNATP